MNDTIEAAQKPTMDNPQSPPACSTNQVCETGPSQFEVYADYNRMLRTWFVVFGVGSIAALIGSKDLVEGLRSAGALRCVVMLLAFGAGAQIILAFINKTAAWCQFYGECNPAFLNGRICKAAAAISSYFIIDVVADLATMGFFIAATIVALNILAPI